MPNRKFFVAARSYNKKPIQKRLGQRKFSLSSTTFTEVDKEAYEYAEKLPREFFCFTKQVEPAPRIAPAPGIQV